MNHLRVLKAWADAHQGQALLDLSTFELEVKARNRYYRLFPQFLAEQQGGRMAHVTSLTPQSTSFIGWRPYRPASVALSIDKLDFKRALLEEGLPTPAHWATPEQATCDYVLKRSMGSFGYELFGPFRAGQVGGTKPPVPARGKLYAEAFVAGCNVKAWFWGEQPVHVQSQAYPRVIADGQRTVKALVAQRLLDYGVTLSTYREIDVVKSCLVYQQLDWNARLPAGTEFWIDYRYGRTFTHARSTEAEDNAWPRLPEPQREQILRAGRWLSRALEGESRAPLLCAMDAVLDGAGALWWLELNSNPVCPPTAYFPMLGTLFGTSPEATPAAYAQVVRNSGGSAAVATELAGRAEAE